ncbi:unnamed protein product [Lampetra fluviatilis]
MEEEGGGVTGRRFPEPMGAARRTPSAVAPRGQGRPGGRGEEVRVVVVVAARVEDGGGWMGVKTTVIIGTIIVGSSCHLTPYSHPRCFHLELTRPLALAPISFRQSHLHLC